MDVFPSRSRNKSFCISQFSVAHATCTTHFSPFHLAGSRYVTVELLLLLVWKAVTMNELIPNIGHCCDVLWRIVTCCSVLAVILQRGKVYRDTWIGEQPSSYCMFLNVILRLSISYWCNIISDYTMELNWIVNFEVICDKNSLCFWYIIQKSDLTGW